MSPLVLFRVLGVGTWSFLWKRHTDIYNKRKPNRLRQKLHACLLYKIEYNITMKKYLIKTAIWSLITYSVILTFLTFAIFYAYMDNVLRGYFFA